MTERKLHDRGIYTVGEVDNLPFPTVPGAFQVAHAGGFRDAFVASVANTLPPLR